MGGRSLWAHAVTGFRSRLTSQNEMNVSISMNIHEPAVPWPRWNSWNPCWYR